MVFQAIILMGIIFSVTVYGQEGAQSSWLSLSESDLEKVESHAIGYKKFMGRAKTELDFVREAVSLAKNAGFREFDETSVVRPGDRLYDVNRDRALTVVVVGKEDLREGFRIVVAHMDSPRVELKARPVYGKEGYALLQTNYHGGIKT